jgi:hypothetical protein
MASGRSGRWLTPGDRERVLAALRAGGRVVDVAAAFDVRRMTVYRRDGALADRRGSHSGLRLSFEERVEIAVGVGGGAE